MGSWRFYVYLLIAGLLLFSRTRTANAQLVRQAGAYAALAGPVAVSAAMPSFSNPASLADWTGIGASFHFARPYHLPPLHASRVHLAAGGSTGAAELCAERFGYEDFWETTGCLTLAKRVQVAPDVHLALGTRMEVRHLAPAGYAPQHEWAVAFGWVAALREALYVAGTVRQTFRNGETGTDAPSLFAIGIRYSPLGQVAVMAQVDRQLGYAPDPGFGVEVRLVEALSARAGFRLDPLQYCGGLGFVLGFIKADVTIVSHPLLGASSSLTLTVRREI